MNIKVLLTYDDRKNAAGSKPIKYHRSAIGIDSGEETSIYTHIYPEPGKWHMLVLYFRDKMHNVVCAIQTEDKDQLVASNKSSLTKFGKEIVDNGIEEAIKQVYNSKTARAPVVNFLEPEFFAELYFDYNKPKFKFIEGTMKYIVPGKPKGLVRPPKVAIEL